MLEQMEMISSWYEAPQMVWFAEAITHPAGPLISLAAFDYDMIQMPAKKHITLQYHRGLFGKKNHQMSFPQQLTQSAC